MGVWYPNADADIVVRLRAVIEPPREWLDEAAVEIDTLRADNRRLASLVEAQREIELPEMLAFLESIEWREQQSLSGTKRLFCSVCNCVKPLSEPGFTHRYNVEHGSIREDGHQLRGGITFHGPCTLASMLDRLRAATDPAAVGEREVT